MTPTRFQSCCACALLVLAMATSIASAQFLMMPDSTNNRVVLFDPNTGAVVNPSYFPLTPSATPIHAMQVGNQIWVSEQVGDRVARYDLAGNFLGQIGGGTTGGLDNIRGMEQVGNTIYVSNGGSGNGAPSANSVVMFDTTGANLGFFSTANLAPSPFAVLDHQGGLLVDSSSGNDDVHRFSLTGTPLGTFHNTTSLNFGEQMVHATNGDVLVGGFSTNNVVRLDPTTGVLISSFAASGARGVYQLGNGNIMWTSGTGAFVFDVNTGGSTQVYAGGGRYVDLLVVPEPGTAIAIAGASVMLIARRRRAS
jgi:outer membrane protein assembly factor BamB